MDILLFSSKDVYCVYAHFTAARRAHKRLFFTSEEIQHIWLLCRVVFMGILWLDPQRALKLQIRFKGDRCLFKILYWNKQNPFPFPLLCWQLALNALSGQHLPLLFLQLPASNRTSESTKRKGQQIHRATITNDRFTGNRQDTCFVPPACQWMLGR